MASAELEQTSADIDVKGRDGKAYMLRATGSVVNFDGFLKVYEEGRDDRVRVVEKGKDDPPKTTPTAAACRHSTRATASPTSRSTPNSTSPSRRRAFPRRPSSSAWRNSASAAPRPTPRRWRRCVDRGYVKIDKKRLVPEDKGRLVTAFLESFFKKYVEFDYTADLEEKLDLISDNKLDWKEMLREFWRDFTAAVDEIKDLRVGDVLEALNEMLGPHVFPDKGDGSDPRALSEVRHRPPVAQDLRQERRLHRLRQLPRLQLHAPARRPGRAVRAKNANSASIPKPVCRCCVKNGRFGTYLQIGEGSKTKNPSAPRSRRASMPRPSISKKRCSCSRCRVRSALIPKTGTPIVAGLGRFGPFILHDGTYANVATIEDVFTIGVNRAVTVMADKKAGKGGPLRPRSGKDRSERPRRTSHRGRQDRSARRQVRPLRQPQQGQRHGAEGHRTREPLRQRRHPPARRAHRQGRRQGFQEGRQGESHESEERRR